MAEVLEDLPVVIMEVNFCKKKKDFISNYPKMTLQDTDAESDSGVISGSLFVLTF
jgi:hypothetical protein